MFERGKSDALFTDTLDLLDTLNTRDGRFEYADYVSLHNNITALYDSFSEVDELMEMDKAEAEGRLVVLPCKVGDTVYAYDDVFNQIAPYKVDMIQLYGHSSMSFCANWRKGGELMADLDFDKADIGKTVFFTREAAEKALGGVEG